MENTNAIRQVLDNIKVCYPAALLPKQNEEGKLNVFVGFGLWSKSHGLSAGLPVDILTMLITADRLRNQISPETGCIYVYIADHLALESREDQPDIGINDILARRDETIRIVHEVCEWLKIKNVVIEDSRALEHSAYPQILHEVESRQSSPCIQEANLDKTTENYVLKQTALIAFYQQEKNCAIKVSWCFNKDQITHDSRQIINDGIKNNSYDELWFDAYYTQLLEENYAIGFVYTQSGISLNNGGSKNTSSPYFAKNQTDFPRILFGDSIEALKGNEIIAGKITRTASNGASVKKGSAKTEKPVIQFKYQLPPTFKKFNLAILEELKENYAGSITIKSRKQESDVLTIIHDLAQVANLGKLVFRENNEKTAKSSCRPGLFDKTNQQAINANRSLNKITNKSKHYLHTGALFLLARKSDKGSHVYNLATTMPGKDYSFGK